MLVKTAIYGEDANWGRIIMAIGKTSEQVNQNKLSLKIGNFVIVHNGKISSKLNENHLINYMKNKIIKIELNLKMGAFNKTVWSSDLTNKYIEINAGYRS